MRCQREEEEEEEGGGEAGIVRANKTQRIRFNDLSNGDILRRRAYSYLVTFFNDINEPMVGSGRVQCGRGESTEAMKLQ